MKKVFEPGDIVQLKSGGPEWTVVKFDAENAICTRSSPSGITCNEDIPISALCLAGDVAPRWSSVIPLSVLILIVGVFVIISSRLFF